MGASLGTSVGPPQLGVCFTRGNVTFHSGRRLKPSDLVGRVGPQVLVRRRLPQSLPKPTAAHLQGEDQDHVSQ